MKTPKQRLAADKAKSDSYRGIIGGYDTWQDATRQRIRGHYSPYNKPFAVYGENQARWIEDTEEAGLRLVGYVTEFRDSTRFRPKPSLGWYSTNFQDVTLYPVGYRLPSRKGAQRFVYGYADPCNEGAALLCFDPCDSEDDAQRWACAFTKRAAEEHREEDAKYQAEQQIEGIVEELGEIRRRVLALCSELKTACKALADKPAIVATLRAALKSEMRERESLFRRRAKLQKDYWLAVPQ